MVRLLQTMVNWLYRERPVRREDFLTENQHEWLAARRRLRAAGILRR
jgi:hypothetical protein